MKGRLIALDHWQGREAAALLVDGRLEDLLIDVERGPRLGAIFAARVERPMKGQGGAIVTWDGGQGFLRRAKGLVPGQVMLVQVSGYAEPGKAPPVTDRVLFKSRYAIVTPGAPGLNISRAIRDDDRRDALQVIAKAGMDGSGHGLILRSASAAADDDAILDDIGAMLDACEAALALLTADKPAPQDGAGPHLTAWCEWVEPAQIDTSEGSFEAHGVLDALDALASPYVPLGPHSMYIEPTRALTAVDVNTGSDLSQAAALKANLAAIKDLPRQLRLRGIGGQITVDFAPISKRDRRQVETALRAACRADAVDTEVIGWTPLGHMELKRKRERVPLTFREA
ncbi:MAG: ribonuclease E/G [Pseudomonadota bacterium]